jgi:hypothetical protein
MRPSGSSSSSPPLHPSEKTTYIFIFDLYYATFIDKSFISKNTKHLFVVRGVFVLRACITVYRSLRLRINPWLSLTLCVYCLSCLFLFLKKASNAFWKTIRIAPTDIWPAVYFVLALVWVFSRRFALGNTKQTLSTKVQSTISTSSSAACSQDCVFHQLVFTSQHLILLRAYLYQKVEPALCEFMLETC